MGLVQVIALLVPFNAGMKVIDDFFMLELTIGVVPAAISVEPENSLIRRDLNCFNYVYSHMSKWSPTQLRRFEQTELRCSIFLVLPVSAYEPIPRTGVNAQGILGLNPAEITTL